MVRQTAGLPCSTGFSYPFNNLIWSQHHEADWEMIYIYLYETAAGELRPEWLAYARMISGDDLCRRWDDPEVEKSANIPWSMLGLVRISSLLCSPASIFDRS